MRLNSQSVLFSGHPKMGNTQAAAGRPAVITGGANGIGLAAAKACIAIGCHPVIICDVNEAALSSAKESLMSSAGQGQEVHSLVLDVADVQANEALAADVFNKYGDVAFVFLNAGKFCCAHSLCNCIYVSS